MAVSGPCLLDLQNIAHTDTQHIAYIYTGRFIGYLVGAVLGKANYFCITNQSI